MPSDYIGTIHLDSHVINRDPGNTLASFKTHLGSAFEYGNDDYEAGIVNITYTNSWYNIPKDSYLAITNNVSAEIQHVMSIPEGRYESAKAILDLLNSMLDATAIFDEHKWGPVHDQQVCNIDHKYGHICPGYECVRRFLSDAVSNTTKEEIIWVPPHLEWSPSDMKVRVTRGEFSISAAKSRSLFPVFSRDVAEMLGMPYCLQKTHMRLKQVKQGSQSPPPLFHPAFKVESTCWTNSHEVQEDFIKVVDTQYDGLSPIDKTAGLNCLFVYTDIIKHHPVGNTQKQLLRVIPVPNDSRFGDTVSQEFVSPQFYPLQHKSFSSIEVSICDGSGRLVPFKFGRVVIVLEIRKRNSSYG